MRSPSPPSAFVHLVAHPVRWRLLTALAGSDYRVRELAALAGEPQNLVSYHLRLLRAGGLVTRTRSSFDGRDGYYHLDLDRCATALADTGALIHPALRVRPAPRTPPTDLRRSPRLRVLFVCTGNSARSPIAEALLRRRCGDQVDVTSAGTVPRSRVHPDAVRVLRHGFGIDIRDRRPRHVDTMTGRRFDVVVSVCDRAREALPDFADDPRRVHWSIPEPAAPDATRKGGYPAFKHAATGIETRVRHLLPVLADIRSPRRIQP